MKQTMKRTRIFFKKNCHQGLGERGGGGNDNEKKSEAKIVEYCVRNAYATCGLGIRI